METKNKGCLPYIFAGVAGLACVTSLATFHLWHETQKLNEELRIHKVAIGIAKGVVAKKDRDSDIKDEKIRKMTERLNRLQIQIIAAGQEEQLNTEEVSPGGP